MNQPVPINHQMEICIRFKIEVPCIASAETSRDVAKSVLASIQIQLIEALAEIKERLEISISGEIVE